MMYGPPPPDYPRYPEYPRATNSPPIIVLVSGLAALLGFLLGVLVGFGAGTTSGEEPPDPRVTVTVEDTPPPAEESVPPGQTTQPPPAQTQPGSTGQPQPGSTGQPQPGTTGQPQPGTTGQPQPGTTGQGQTQPGLGTTPGATGLAVDISSLLRTLVVGTDIQPGTYRTSGPMSGFPMCYWARLRTPTGGVIATGMPNGPATVTILATDKAFQTGGCVEWTKA
ncbi:hypothetical protein FXF51_48615 [Nonomuraea sp. PA05]|uniref:hypothetical protein n=1 Tax=Nonomuraea sp. PA05 TaxID=2604466 RepID=UPI0011D72954|nr:hypothetical protein [Nonomuraea sp. PA05]TYB54233.1 hypothetical protein FXF51_48615 [Nonomuraea sp. PA05]